MNSFELIEQVKIDASEWIEMCDDPAMFIAGILANKVIHLTDQIEYLEKRLQGCQHERTSKKI